LTKLILLDPRRKEFFVCGATKQQVGEKNKAQIILNVKFNISSRNEFVLDRSAGLGAF
jgi:hypothetical protein